MSWSAYFVGTPEKIEEALNKQSGNLSGQSKQEYDDALPHLVALIKSNSDGKGGPLVQIQAAGSAYFLNGEMQNSTCNVNIQQLHGALV
jgi:hypothetical protein